MTDMQPLVLFTEIETESHYKIGHATLNKLGALNALDIEMITLLTPMLERWQADPNISMVILDSVGDKAFCAGGDIVTMYHQMKQHDSADKSFALQDFFSQEYALDYLIHTYSKPILLWGHGIVMGGGLGLMAGASHRIVTEKSRIGMPEISIGLYPDVGGSYFLNKMPAGAGLFLGLTAASMNAADALYVNLADYFISHDAKASFLQRLKSADWVADSPHHVLSDICQTLHQEHQVHIPQGNLAKHQDWLTRLSTLPSLVEIMADITSICSEDDKWLAKAQKTMRAGSPITAHIVFEQLKRGTEMTLAECFQMELGLSCKCGQFGEFQEGVRALLIDKDGQPNWHYGSVESVPTEVIDNFFAEIWSDDNHPLTHLSQGQ